MSGPILVIDDNKSNVKLATATLQYAGYEVIAAESAEAARALIDATPTLQLILMDVSLPNMDGLTFTRQLKADPRTRHIPIVILTASAMKGDEKSAMAAGADAYLSKPFHVPTFAATIAAYIIRAGNFPPPDSAKSSRKPRGSTNRRTK